ncbi:MAG: glutamate racemase [Actinobacteria bacterium]|nr:glutamate racemase [Actinomycetota bacterium]
MDKRPIGIFDSGVGGLTVLREIIKKAPAENLFYFGDTARFPYGTKKLEDVKRFVFKIAEFLCNRDIKLLVAACNTASAAALEDLRKDFDIPVIGVIEPGAKAAVENTQNKRIGVIATEGTVKSAAYDKAIHKIDKTASIFSSPATLLIDYIEKGVLEGYQLDAAISECISPLTGQDIDVLILGCTHFPLIEQQIKARCNDGFKIISSAEETAKEVVRILCLQNIENASGIAASRMFFETGSESRLLEIGKRFLGDDIKEIISADLDIQPS